jgi:hypothetical protein
MNLLPQVFKPIDSSFNILVKWHSMDFESLPYLILAGADNSSIYHTYYLQNNCFVLPKVMHSIYLGSDFYDCTLFIPFDFPNIDLVRYSCLEKYSVNI